MFQHILCPVDFSTTADRAVRYALELGRKLELPVTLLHVVEQPTFVAPGNDAPLTTSVIERLRNDRCRELRSYLERMAGTNAAVQSQLLVVDDQSTARAIVDQLDKFAEPVIVMGTHGRSGIKRLAYGSTAENVLRLSPVPVLVVPPAASS